VAQQAFVVSAAYAVTMGSIGFFFAAPVLSLLGLEPDVVAEGAAYMRIQFAGAAVMSFWMMAEAIMQASGDTLTPMKITIAARSIHAVLDPFFIFGWWIFPCLGVSGAAVANLVGYSVGMALGLWVLFSGRTRLWLTLRNFRLDLNIIWRIVKIGIPASIMGVQRSLGNLILVRLIAPFGTLAVAAHSLCQRVEMILYMPCSAMGMGAGVLAGQNLGARQPERAEKSGWQALGLAEGYMVICSVAVVLWPESIIRIFSSQPGLVEIGSAFLRIAAAGYLVMGFEAILQQSISGAGDTLPSMAVSLVAFWLVQMPLAFFLPQVTNLGVYGVRWAMVTSVVVGVIAYTIYFRLGRWKRKKV
jgi:putative MATE family efflux protein